MRTHSITVAVIALLLVSSVSSWGEVGHLLVAQICAYDLMTHGYQDVLRKAEEIVLQGADLTPKLTRTFAGVSLYADELKSAGVNEFDEMHYFDMILNPNGLSVKEAAESSNALSFITKTINAFNSTRQGPYTWTHTFLLRMLIHIVGDMHQPLHMTTMYNEEFLAGDQGGNKFKIHYSSLSEAETKNLKLPTNLHAYWDQGAGLFPSFPVRPLSQENQTWIGHYAASMWKNYTRTSFHANLTEKNITKWGKAIFNISRDVVYPPLLANGHAVTPNYTNTMFPLMEQLITLAGYRLSDILVSLLADTTGETAVRTPIPKGLYEQHLKMHGFVADNIRKSKENKVPKEIELNLPL